MLICLKRNRIKRVCKNLYEVKENYTDMVWCRNNKYDIEIESDMKSVDLKQALLKVFKESAIICDENDTPIAVKGSGWVLRPTPYECFATLNTARDMLNGVMVKCGTIYDDEMILNEIRYTIRDTKGKTIAIIYCEYTIEKLEIAKATLTGDGGSRVVETIRDTLSEKWKQPKVLIF